MVRRSVPVLVSVLVMAAPLIGCSGGGSTNSDGAPDSTVPPAVTSTTFDAPAPPTSITSITSTAPAPPAPPAAPPSVVTVPSSPPAPLSSDGVAVSDPPQTGVPGAADSPFCRAYGTMVVTDYLVGLVEAFGDERGARRAEVVAAPAFVAASAAAVAALTEVGPTTDPFAERWSGYGDRARFVIGTGVPADELVAVWERVLLVHDRNDPTLEIELTPELSATVDAAVVALQNGRGPLASDATYRSMAAIATPDVDRYVAERCPGVAQASTGDAV